MDVGRLKSLQRGENPALIFFKPARLLNQGRGDNGKGTMNYQLTAQQEEQYPVISLQ